MRRLRVTTVILCTSYVASCFGFGVYLFGTVAPDMRADLQLDPEAIGIASGAAQAGLMISALLAGLLAHRIGYFRLVLMAQGLSSACLVLVAFCTKETGLVVLLTLLGCAASAIWVPTVSLAGAVVPERHRGVALGVMAAGTSYGVLLNGLFAAPVVAGAGWRFTWIAAGVVSFTLLAAGAWLLRPLFSVGAQDAGETSLRQAPGLSPVRISAVELLHHSTALKAIVITAVNGLAFLPFQTYLTSLFRDGHGWSAEAATALWSAIGIGGLGGGLGFGVLSDRISAQRSLVAAYAVLVPACLTVLMTDSFVAVFVAALIFGLAYSGIFGLMATYVSKCFPVSAAGLIGMTLVALGFGSMTGNYAGGLLIARGGGYGSLYGGLAILVAMNVVLSAALPRDGQPFGEAEV